MNFDIQYVPFSRYGSYFALSYLQDPKGLFIRVMHGENRGALTFRIELIAGGKSIPFSYEATPSLLRLIGKTGSAEFCIPTGRVLRFRSLGAGVRISEVTPYPHRCYRGPDNRWVLREITALQQYMLTPLQGSLEIQPAGKLGPVLSADFLPDDSGQCAGAMEEFCVSWIERGYGQDFDVCARNVQLEFDAFADDMPSVPREYHDARMLASYIMWSCVVDPQGRWTRPAMLMSKNWMPNLWSWDNCFNAMAMVKQRPELAWDQIMIMADNQHPLGAFPDHLNDVIANWNWVKPPIHGWSLRWMMRRSTWIDRKRLAEIYSPLCRWTDWWMTYRDFDRDGMPQYHHGNDSGWDNATCFDDGCPVEGPDLAAYLSIQMDVLSEVAQKLGKTRAARQWKDRSAALLNRLIEHSWRGDRFVATRSGDHHIADGDTLLNYLPIVLGKRLPKPIREKLIAGLGRPGRFMTRWGLATENIKSKYYESDGYWRGPIWGPSTMICADGLAAAGAKELSRKIARRYCDLCNKSGFAENFDAVTGAIRRDPAYTWTASAFLCLAHEYI